MDGTSYNDGICRAIVYSLVACCWCVVTMGKKHIEYILIGVMVVCILVAIVILVGAVGTFLYLSITDLYAWMRPLVEWKMLLFWSYVAGVTIVFCWTLGKMIMEEK